jgi:hypothetical protein
VTGVVASRRDVLRAGAATAVVAVTAPGPAPSAAATTSSGVLDLHINDGFVPMVDGSLVYMRGFGERQTDRRDPAPSLTISPQAFLANGDLVDGRVHPIGAPKPPHGRPAPGSRDPDAPGAYRVLPRTWASIYPRRTIIAETGATVRLRIHNHLGAPHRFQVQDIGVDVALGTGAVQEIEFPAPRPGTYVYSDPTNAPVERVLGLHGVLLVIDPADPWRATPGSTIPFERQWLWIIHDVDPVWAQLASQGQAINPVTRPSVPRYFTLNDRSGFQSLALTQDEAYNDRVHEETLPSGWPRKTDVRTRVADGRVGQVVRMVNTGVAVHQMHFHGNHIWTFRRENDELSRTTATFTADAHIRLQQWEDVVELDPLQRADVLLPLKPPPDVVPAVWAARTGDWTYPMHCHAEMSQTAGGGVYPGGLVADWVLAGGTPPTGGV